MKEKPELSQKLHRQRLRARINSNGIESLHEHEVVEYLLMMCIPQKDVKPLAYSLLNQYGSISGILNAGYDELLTMNGIAEYSATFLSNLPRIFGMYKQSEMCERTTLISSSNAAEYCESLFYGMRKEVFYAITLDAQSRLIQNNLLGKGTVDEVHIYARDVAEVATRQKAVYILLTHNHPGGDSRASESDIELTYNVAGALIPLNILLIDHIIISDTGFMSFRASGMLTRNGRPSESDPAVIPRSRPELKAAPKLAIAAEKEQRPKKPAKPPKTTSGIKDKV